MVWRNAVDIQGKNLRADSWMREYFCQFESKSKAVNFVKIAINANILGGNGLFNHKNIMQICLMLILPVEYFVVVLIFA